MKIAFSTFLIICIMWFADAQVITSSNNYFLSFLGDASAVSLKYERSYSFKSGFVATGVGVGIGTSGLFGTLSNESISEKSSFATIPHHVTYNLGRGKHFLEAGFGGSVLLGSPNEDYLVYPTLGYRFQNFGNFKSNFRVFVQAPLGGNPGNDVLFIPLGFSLGSSF